MDSGDREGDSMNKIIFYHQEVDKLIKGVPVMPVTCEIDPSNDCQLDCSFCISDGNKSSSMMGMEFFTNVLCKLQYGGTKSITFTGGGEPTINPAFNDMALLAANMGFNIALITNGLLLDSVRVELFEFIRVSLDAGSRDIYTNIKGEDYFHKVLSNIELVRPCCKVLGLSYVIDGQPQSDIAVAEALAESLAVDYIQFKPENGLQLNKPILHGTRSLWTERERDATELSCMIAGLIGIITADGRYVFCCQHRYDSAFTIANLHDESLENAIKTRIGMQKSVDRSSCVSCRYSSYAESYLELQESKNIFLKHKDFL